MLKMLKNQFTLKEYQEEKDKLSSVVPWESLIEKGIITNKNGTLQKTFKFRGHDLDNSTTEELEAFTSRLNKIIMSFDTGWSLFTEVKRIKSDEYIKSQFDSLAGQIIEDERYNFFSKGNHYESEYYLTIVYLTPKDTEKKLNDLIIEKSSTTIKKLDDDLIYFKKGIDKIILNLQNILLEINELSDSETYTYLHSCVSEKYSQKLIVPSCNISLNNYLCDTFVVGGLKPRLGQLHIRAISVNGFPQFSHPGFFDKLNRLGIEYRWCSRFLALGKQESLSLLESKYKFFFRERITMLQRAIMELTKNAPSKENEDSIEKAGEVNTQINLTRGDYVSQGYYSCTVIVSDKNKDEADKKALLVSKEIDDLGFTTIIESVNSYQCFLSAIPGNIYHNRRKPILNSLTLSHLLPTNSIWAGDKTNKHLNAAPLLYTQTEGSTTFRFNLHVNDIGHTLIAGPSGSGKSVLLGAIASQFKKYKNSKIFFFDKDSSSRVLTYAMGGNFFDVGKDNMSFQPLKDLKSIDEKEILREINTINLSKKEIKILVNSELSRRKNELMWANEWVSNILEQEKVELNPELKEKLWKGLLQISTNPKELKTLTNLFINVQDNKIKEALKPYTITGNLGALFDSNKEDLSFSSWNVFEMGQAITNKQAIAPLLSYLFHEVEKSLDGNPVLIVCDEAWMYFDNPQFATKLRDWLKTLRKKNASMVFATQELNDIAKSVLFNTVLETCDTKIYLANPNAISELGKSIYSQFGLNNTEILTISKLNPKMDYFTRTKKGDARKFNLKLGKLTLKLIASSDTLSQEKATQLNNIVKNADEFTELWIKGENL